jgi:hypothetical protein
MKLPMSKISMGSMSLVMGLSLNIGCSKVTFSSSLPDTKASTKQGVDPAGVPPGAPSGVPVTTPPTVPGVVVHPPGDGPQTDVASRCGGPANPAAYTGNFGFARSQSRELFSSYAACTAARAAIFGNAMVCSKMVSATILGCYQTPDLLNAAMELDLLLPVLKSNNQMETPYDYFLLGVPNCAIAAGYINANMGANIPVASEFTTVRADVQAECLNATDVVIHVRGVY